MWQARHRMFFFAFFSFFFLNACTQTGGRIGHAVNVCCPGDYQSYAAYGLITYGIPGFSVTM